LSPFAGIGSEGYEAIRLNRRFLGIELKGAYATVAAKNLAVAEGLRQQGELFSVAE
jgi:DNA modification methylase